MGTPSTDRGGMQQITAEATAHLDRIAELLDLRSAGRLPEGGAGEIIDAAESLRSWVRHGFAPAVDTDARRIAWSHAQRVAPVRPASR